MRAKIFVVLQSVFLGVGMLSLLRRPIPRPPEGIRQPSARQHAASLTPLQETIRPAQRPAETSSDLGVHYELVRPRF